MSYPFQVYMDAAKRVRRKRGAHYLAVHPSAHIDEDCAALLVILYGMNVFSSLRGIDPAEWRRRGGPRGEVGGWFRQEMLYNLKYQSDVFNSALEFENFQIWNTRGIGPDGLTGTEAIAKGAIVLGCDPKTPLDEHPIDGVIPEKKECATTLTAKMHGVHNKKKNPELKSLLNYVWRHDTMGGQSPFELGEIVKGMLSAMHIRRRFENEGLPKDEHRLLLNFDEQVSVIKYAWTGMMALILKQVQFKPSLDFYRKSRSILGKRVLFGEQEILIVAAETNQSSFIKAATSGSNGEKAQVVIQRSEDTKETAILVDHDLYQPDIERVNKALDEFLEEFGDPKDPDGIRKHGMRRAAKLKAEEAKARLELALRRAVMGLRSWELCNEFDDPNDFDRDLLKAEGDLTEVLQWHFHKDVPGIFNRGPTHPGAPATEMKLEVVLEIVADAFSDKTESEIIEEVASRFE